MRKLLLSFVVLGLAVASAKSYNMTLFQSANVGTSQLAPGDYKVEVMDRQVVIRNGATEVKSAVKVETVKEKYRSTTVRFDNAGGAMRVQEIRLGGTNTKLVLTEAGAD